MQLQIRSRGIAAVAGTALLVFSGVASAQLDKQETKCANSINKGAAKVAKAQAGHNAACIKDGGKGRLSGTIEDCLVSDPKGKVSKAIGKIKTSDCTTGAPTFLPGLQTDASTIGDTMVQDLDLIHALFGSDLDVSIVSAEDDKAGARCQAAIAKTAGKCQDAKLSTYNSCKKNWMKDGSITDANSLQDNCLGTTFTQQPDSKSKIAKKCGVPSQGFARADFGFAKNCLLGNVDALIPGCTPRASAACIDQKIGCEVCLALNALDGLIRDCDLFDDRRFNDSCAQPEEIGSHNCTLDTDPNTFEFNFIYQAFNIPVSISGGIDISCSVIDPNTGKALCRCTIQSLTPFELPGIGFICLEPGTSCPNGEIDCTGGNALGWETVADHNIGAGCANPLNCFGPCSSYCSGLGGGYLVKADQLGCTMGICSCQCLRKPAGPSSAGDINCQLPIEINVEALAPCDGTDITIPVFNVCIPLSTQSSLTGTGMISPATLTGTAADCLDLESSITAGIELVGQIDFFEMTIGDLTIGDLKSQQNFTCQ